MPASEVANLIYFVNVMRQSCFGFQSEVFSIIFRQTQHHQLLPEVMVSISDISGPM